MTLSTSKHIISADAYATAADFQRIFTDDMSGLYLLSFLLAGDPDKAETVFAAGVEECTSGKRVFKEWARSWARRSIIQSAIRIIGPLQNSQNVVQNSAVARALQRLPLALQAEASAIIELAPFERFVFVMSVLGTGTPPYPPDQHWHCDAHGTHCGKNPENLTDRQQVKLAWIANTDPRLYRAYLLKEG